MGGLSWNQVIFGVVKGARLDEFYNRLLDANTERLIEMMRRRLERMDTDEPAEHGDPGDETD